jgi:hypothetical protein
MSGFDEGARRKWYMTLTQQSFAQSSQHQLG